jgi:hypothetical protein
MTQADRVHSTPPTNTSAIQAQSSRRTFLAQAAGVAAGGAALGAGLPLPAPAATLQGAPDPVFELIEAHRKTHADHMAAIETLNRFERRHGPCNGNWITEKPCHIEHEAFHAFIAAPATTPQGLFAKLNYLQDLASEFETEWMIDECVYTFGLIESFAVSLKNIGVQP